MLATALANFSGGTGTATTSICIYLAYPIAWKQDTTPTSSHLWKHKFPQRGGEKVSEDSLKSS